MKLGDFIKDLEKSSDASSTAYAKLEIILDILRKINSSLVLKDVLELVLKNAIKISQSERGFIVLKDPNGNLEFMLCLDSEGKALSKELFNISTTVVNEVFNSGQSKFIESALDGTTATSQSIINLELQTIMCSPLITKDEKIGVIYVDSKQINKIKNKIITETFEILAGQAAIAIYNALMHHRQITANDELKKAYQELELAKQEAQKFEKLKNHFLLQMSHEIRTPFNIILGSTQLLRSNRKELDLDETSKLFDMLEKGSQRIIRTVDEIMEMAKIESGSYEVQKENINLESDILQPILNTYTKIAHEKGLELVYENVSDGCEINCDKFMTYQIFQEIIDNAIKFTLSGKVCVKLFTDVSKKITVNISDTGVGISEEYLQNIFKPFSQEDTGYSRKFEGNGLALALVKKYADINEILIDVTSKKKVGSSFTLQFK